MSNQNSSSEIEKTLKAMEEAKLRNKQVFIEKNWENQNPTENKPVAVQEEAAQLKANPEKNTGKSKNLTSWGYVKRFLIMLLGGWLGLHVLLGFMQREILYFGSNNPAGNPEKYGFAKGNVDEFNLVVKSENGVRLAGWHVLPQGSTIEMWNRDLKNFNNSPAAEGEKFLNETAIIYFPGNAGHRGYRSATLNDLASLNSHVFIVDYRGYSDSTGSPTEKNLVMDSIQLYDYVLSMGFNPRRVILFGESLGGESLHNLQQKYHVIKNNSGE